jgi:hypothetical protein
VGFMAMAISRHLSLLVTFLEAKVSSFDDF